MKHRNLTFLNEFTSKIATMNDPDDNPFWANSHRSMGRYEELNEL